MSANGLKYSPQLDMPQPIVVAADNVWRVLACVVVSKAENSVVKRGTVVCRRESLVGVKSCDFEENRTTVRQARRRMNEFYIGVAVGLHRCHIRMSDRRRHRVFYWRGAVFCMQ